MHYIHCVNVHTEDVFGWFYSTSLQDDLLVALGQGSRLLESINEPVVRDPDHNMNQDEMENMATVQRLEPHRNQTLFLFIT